MSPAMSAAVDIALRREGMIVATTDDDAADAIETVPGAFGGTTLSLVLSEKRALRILSLDGIMPSLRTMADRSYPYSKTFFMVTKNNPPAAVRRFIDFVRSPAGSAILAKNGQAAVRQDGHPSMKDTGRNIPRLIEGFGGLLLLILAVALPVALLRERVRSCKANISGRKRRSMPARCPP